MKRYIISADRTFATELDNVVSFFIERKDKKKYYLKAKTHRNTIIYFGSYTSKKVACLALEKVLDAITDDCSVIYVLTEEDVRLFYMD